MRSQVSWLVWNKPGHLDRRLHDLTLSLIEIFQFKTRKIASNDKQIAPQDSTAQ